MKRYILIFVSLFTIFELSAQELYRYIAGEKSYLNAASDRAIVKLANNAQTQSFLNSNNTLETDQNNVVIVKFQNTNIVQNTELLDTWKNENTVAYYSPIFVDENGKNMAALTDQILIRLKNISDYSILQTISIQNNLEILEQTDFDKKTYILQNHSPNKNAIQISNELFETGLFDYVEPNFILFINYSTNDTYFNDQWGLNNTGQYGGTGTAGIDINAPEAWTITTGSANIKIAILDSGVDLTHPDLIDNLLSGFDATGGSNGGNHSGVGHGTCCAGIAAARGNNSQGVAGVAYNCRIMPIHMGSSPLSARVASGMNWAVENGANVISMSFSTTATNATNIEMQEAETANCVLVAATGNNNANAISYPATLPNVIAVGAISPCGQRKSPSSCDGEYWWGSNYGNGLDVVAPGVFIPTTTYTGGYTQTFNGTSSATPHVAGVAALVLSVNPNLTGQQVRDIIESTAQKVGGYTYQTTSGHPNGTWNNEMGYGLVDAYAAVQAACTSLTVNFTNQTVTTNTDVTSCGDINVQNVNVTNNAKLTLDAAGSTTIESGFEMELGSELEIK